VLDAVIEHQESLWLAAEKLDDSGLLAVI